MRALSLSEVEMVCGGVDYYDSFGDMDVRMSTGNAGKVGAGIAGFFSIYQGAKEFAGDVKDAYDALEDKYDAWAEQKKLDEMNEDIRETLRNIEEEMDNWARELQEETDRAAREALEDAEREYEAALAAEEAIRQLEEERNREREDHY
jgi:Zn-dependent M32 family carboxypeptidase